MSHILEISDTLYAALKETAEANGLTPVEWIAVRLSQNANATGSETEKKRGDTLAELFAGRVGRIRSGGKASLSDQCGAKFADYLEAKRKAGHL